MTNQDTIFLETEADQWFKRNQVSLNPEGSANNSDKMPLFLLGKHPKVRPSSVLEIGCANGWRLEEIRKIYGCSCTGIEPSAGAVEEGKKFFPQVSFDRGLASKLPYEDSTFDLVIVNFVFHWVSRDQILRSIAEADRVLADQGHLLIGDFCPDKPCKRRYHHLPKQEVFTYKQNYPEIFLSTKIYDVVEEIKYERKREDSPADDKNNEKRSCVLLRKDLSGAYPVQSTS